MEKEKNKIKFDIKAYFGDLKRKWWVLLIEAVLLGGFIALDLTMKDYLYNFLESKPGMVYTLIPGFIDLNYSENTGAGFSMFDNSPVALSVVTALLIAGVLAFLLIAVKQSEWARIPLVCIAAGGIGNLADRIQLGYVRDFFEFTFMDFAIFNIADIFVTLGAFALIIYLIAVLVQEGAKGRREHEAAQKAGVQEEHAPSELDELLEDMQAPAPINNFLDDGEEKKKFRIEPSEESGGKADSITTEERDKDSRQ